MGSSGGESLKSFARARFPPLKPKAVGKPKKGTRQVSTIDATLGRLEKSPPASRTWYKSTRKAGSIPASFSAFDSERKEALLRLAQEAEELRESCLISSTAEAISDEGDVISSQRSLSPVINADESMDICPDADIPSSSSHPMEMETSIDPVPEPAVLNDTVEQVTPMKSIKHKDPAGGPSARQTAEYKEWETLLPSLRGPYLHFLRVEEQEVSPSMLGVHLLDSKCNRGCIMKLETRVLCLFLECTCSINESDLFSFLLQALSILPYALASARQLTRYL